ncbi:unnamed protein product [Haemonchus placei]|uniref:RNA helicase n=1 Tax=Haemonchus placei TaxID=6290 RepID=A0A0N4X1W7_HAEPC|nr:unnamed protein product [Haemonchus placei]
MPPQKKMREHKFDTPRLPIHDVEFQIMEALHSHETVVLIGETGCGKSTQVPQFCVRIGLGRKGRIGVTQPRRLAAVSLASRVSEELSSPLGRKVGYHVRFERELSEETKIVFLTDGILLREAIHDPLLRDYSTILVDEAHERSLHTDILLNVLRLCQRQRKETDMLPLRIVIMSATLEAELFSKFFNDAPVFVVKGRTFPVEVYHAELNPDNADYVYNALVCIKDLHQEEPLSDHFLVFLTGREEIEGAAKKLKELNEHFTSPIFPVPLFAAMSSVAQMRAFEPPPEGHRKVVLATNIAETSLTIPGVRVVIDSGKVKTRSFTAANRIDVLRIHDISKAQAIQRAGRAGREAPGKCYRLYPFRHFEKLEATSVPEVLRSNLATVLLEMLALGLRRPRKLKLIQQPEEESMIAAERELLVERLKVFFRVLIIADELACMEEALTIIASMYCETVFEQDGYNDSQDIDRIRARFASNESDHLTVMNVVHAFKQEKQKNVEHLKEWCSHNHLNFKNLTMVLKVRKQLRDIAMECGMKMMSCGAQREKVRNLFQSLKLRCVILIVGFQNSLFRQALACGLFMNACEYSRQEDRYRLLVKPGTTLKIHPSSRLCRVSVQLLLFDLQISCSLLYNPLI